LRTAECEEVKNSIVLVQRYRRLAIAGVSYQHIFMKLLKTNVIDTVKVYQDYFD